MKKLIIFILCIFSSFHVFSEGTMQLDPLNSGTPKLYLNFTDPAYNFAIPGAPENKKLKIGIADPTEIITLGFNVESGNAAGLLIRLIDPNGKLHEFPMPQVPGDAGYINDFNSLSFPPEYGNTGYIGVTSQIAGDWTLEIVGNGSNEVIFKYFDINVLNEMTFDPIPGRVYAHSWQFKLHPDQNYKACNSSLFAIDNFGLISRIRVGAMLSPSPIVIEANSFGTSGDPKTSVKSVLNRVEGAEYKLFLQAPDQLFISTVNAPSPTMSSLNLYSCNQNTHSISFYSSHPGYAEILIRSDSIALEKDVRMRKPVIAGMNTVYWNGVDGANNLVPAGAKVVVQVNGYMLPVNFQVYNAHYNLESVMASDYLSTTAIHPTFFDDSNLSGEISPFGGCSETVCGRWQTVEGSTMNRRFFKRSLTLNNSFNIIIPTANAGPDGIYCNADKGAGFQVSGQLSDDLFSADWRTKGTGVFSNPASWTSTYKPSLQDIQAGSVELIFAGVQQGCPDLLDTMLLTFAVINAGVDQTVCSNEEVLLQGSHINGGAPYWVGAGTFTSGVQSLNTVYIPTSQELTNGYALLYLQGETCNPLVDTLRINLKIAPVTSFELAPGYCSNAPVQDLFPSPAGGSFTGSGITLEGKFDPSQVTSGSSTINYSYTDINGCTGSTAKTTVVSVAPAANAGLNDNICVSSSSYQLSGNYTNSTGVTWSTAGTGVFNPGSTDPNAIYNFSTGDLLKDSIVFILTTTGNGYCDPASSEKIVLLSPLPAAGAGPDQTVCANKEVVLTGSVTGASGGKWTGGAGRFYPDAQTLNATYFPTSTEKANGSVNLLLTTAGNGPCSASSDAVSITFTPAPLVDAGINQSMTSVSVQLDGRVLNATGGTWTSSGTGLFSPSASDLKAQYTPSAGDLTQDKVILTLTTTGNDACNAVQDQMVLTSNAVVCNVGMNLYFNDNNVTFEAFNDDGVSVGSYYWDFGDGSTASGKIQSNVYNQAGTYYVSVFYTTPDSACTAIEYDTVQITQASIPTYTISGLVKANGTNLDKSILTLFKFDGHNYDYLRAMDISETNNGAFAFTGLENGYYLVHALPSPTSAFFNSFAATYFGNDTIWEDAAFIQINNADFTVANIDMVNAVSGNATWNTGIHDVFGTITFAVGVNLKMAEGSENPVENAVVTLYTSTGDRLTSTYTDPFGNYSFDNLEPGEYYMGIEYAGTNMSDTITINADGTGSTTDGSTSLLKEEVVLGLFPNAQGESVHLFPNPASNELYLKLAENNTAMTFSARIFNSAGVLVRESSVKSAAGTVYFNIESLEDGFYLIEMNNGDNVWRERFLKH